MQQTFNTSVSYPTEASKLAFVGNAVKLLKARGVATEGVGTDLPFTLYAWRGDRHVALGWMGVPAERYPFSQRFMSIMNAAFAIRRGWDTDSVTLITDGYCSVNLTGADDDGLDYGTRYANGDPDVSECLYLTHVDHWNPTATIVTLPYTIGYGREIVWGVPATKSEDLGIDNENKMTRFLSLSLDSEALDSSHRLPIMMSLQGQSVHIVDLESPGDVEEDPESPGLQS